MYETQGMIVSIYTRVEQNVGGFFFLIYVFDVRIIWNFKKNVNHDLGIFVQSERYCLDITFTIVLVLLRVFFHTTRRTPEFYYTGQQIYTDFNKNNAKKWLFFIFA